MDDADDHGNTEGLAATAFRQLRDFGTRYRTVLGARPFIKGIRRLLTEQLASPNLLCWHVHEASFTEVSDDFIEVCSFFVCFAVFDCCPASRHGYVRRVYIMHRRHS